MEMFEFESEKEEVAAVLPSTTWSVAVGIPIRKHVSLPLEPMGGSFSQSGSITCVTQSTMSNVTSGRVRINEKPLGH